MSQLKLFVCSSAFIVGLTVAAAAGGNKGAPSAPPGASGFAAGQQDFKAAGTPGASAYAPGQQDFKGDGATAGGASAYTPSQLSGIGKPTLDGTAKGKK